MYSLYPDMELIVNHGGGLGMGKAWERGRLGNGGTGEQQRLGMGKPPEFSVVAYAIYYW